MSYLGHFWLVCCEFMYLLMYFYTPKLCPKLTNIKYVYVIQEHKKEQERRFFVFKATKMTRSGKKGSFCAAAPQEMRSNPCWFHPCQLGAQSISSNSTTCASIPLPLQPELLCSTNLKQTKPNLSIEGILFQISQNPLAANKQAKT